MDLPRYKYEPLDESTSQIRMMVLHPGASDDVITVSLETITLPVDDEQACPEFEALSYTWGSLTDPTNLIVRDGSTASLSTISIMPNLATALPYLRLPDRARRLWIDAVSINQADLAERSSQVKLMSAIYGRAALVLIWLGPADAGTPTACALLADWGARTAVDWSTGGTHQIDDAASSIVHIEEADRDDIYALLAKPWFTRLWIRQEVQLASHAVLLCGRCTIPWPAFRNAIALLNLFPTFSDTAAAPAHWQARTRRLLRELVDYADGHTDLHYEVYSSRAAACTDPRDRIYAVLSLLAEEQRVLIEPDYTIPVESVYERAFCSHLAATCELESLRYCDIGSRSSKTARSLPTWVPNYDCLVDLPYPTSFALASGHRYANCSLHHTANGRSVLRTKGLNVGPATAVSAFAPSSADGLETVKEVRRFLTLATAHLADLETHEQHLTLAHLFGGGDHRHAYDPPNSTAPTEDELMADIATLLDATISDKQCLEQRSHSRLVQDMRGRNLLTTDRGHIGLGPLALRPGDRLAIVLGCSTPLAIRSDPDAAASFQVVGECNVRALMTGEAILGPLPPHWQFVSRISPGGFQDLGFRDFSTGVTQTEDPRWAWWLGEEYEEPWQEVDVADEYWDLRSGEVRLGEILKLRGLEWAWFDLV
ncbi:hypothetical protein LTR53_011296 [Teratosphaeriaceae sp. CCFEE 6253]|nr:hypothetical protein LTR53_011296 [Teratosphaeriaceae sp. CCFEE 6253]